jgi:hypothetical protein
MRQSGTFVLASPDKVPGVIARKLGGTTEFFAFVPMWMKAFLF